MDYSELSAADAARLIREGRIRVPGLALPVGMTAAGLPLGMDLDGPTEGDRRLLSIGLALEALPGPVPAPKR
jgi:Asp-tRNA(Asn)/Glu-tRNA(Gln) amidotransferase A subunit family amidase